MFTHYRTEAFILTQEECGEADYLFTVFTDDFGKLRVLGRGIRKIQSKLRPGIPLFSQSEIEFIEGKHYNTLTDANLRQDFKQIKKSLPRLEIAHRLAELVDQLLTGGEKDEQIWNLLRETFINLNGPACSLPRSQLLFYYFFWNFLSILGYGPELYHCPSCQGKLEPTRLYFSSKEGGVVCPFCQKKKEAGKTIEVGANTVKILRKILAQDWPTLARLKLKREDLRALKPISLFYLVFVSPL